MESRRCRTGVGLISCHRSVWSGQSAQPRSTDLTGISSSMLSAPMGRTALAKASRKNCLPSDGSTVCPVTEVSTFCSEVDLTDQSQSGRGEQHVFLESSEEVRVVPLKCVGTHRWQMFDIPLVSGDVVNPCPHKERYPQLRFGHQVKLTHGQEAFEEGKKEVDHYKSGTSFRARFIVVRPNQ